nr:unnamed protein product [Rangifer tarandus platyrhynchus]
MERRGASGIAWGKDRPEDPESNRRELFFKRWDKINRPEHTACGLQNKGTEKVQRRAGPSPLEVGGRGEGKRANSAPEKPPPPTLQTGPQFLSKDFLRPDWRCALGPRREKARRIRGDCAQASGCLNRSGRGRHKTQVQPNPRFCGVPENWNRTQRRARSI